MMLTSRAGILTRKNNIARRNTAAGLRIVPANGFTFVEALIALAVVSIALLALLRLQLLTIRIADRARVTSQAVFLAEGKIAETLALGYPKPGNNSGTVADNGVALDWQVEVTDLRLPQLSAAAGAGLRKILVDVSWKQRLGRNHLQMTTYVAQKDYTEPQRTQSSQR